MKTITVLYNDHATATRLKNELDELDVQSAEIVTNGDADAMDRIHGYGLSDDDVRTYQHAVRNGQILLVTTCDEEKVDLVTQAMRKPDGVADMDALRTRYADEALIAPSGRPLGAVGSTSTVGLADDGRTTYRDPLEPRE